MRIAPSVACLLLLCFSALADSPVITSFDQNGVITWTNSVNTSAIYRVEWSSSLIGTSVWQRSFQRLNYVEGKSNVSFSAAIPMFFRVVMATNMSPAGMIYVDAGRYELGQSDTNLALDEQPVHTNFIDGFYIDKFTMSKRQWNIVTTWGSTHGYTDLPAGSNGWNSTLNAPQSGSSNHPVTYVGWYDIVKWCNARSERDGLTPCYYIDPIFFNVYRTGTSDLDNSWVNWNANGYRLPTEAEWEVAARGGLRGNYYPWPSYGGIYTQYLNGTKANYMASADDYENGTTPVGYYNGGQTITNSLWTNTTDMANGYGLYDMAGNVYQICWDWYLTNYYAAATNDNPQGPTSGTRRVIRCGSWFNPTNANNAYVYLRCAARWSDPPATSSRNNSGFRTVRRP